MSTDMVFYDGHKTIADLIDNDGRGLILGKTKAELEQKYGPLQIVSLDEATRQMAMSACRAPVEIDREAFDEALKILPPLKWVLQGGLESFRMHEAIAGNVHVSYVRMGKRYFETRRPITDSHEELLGAVTVMLATKPRKR